MRKALIILLIVILVLSIGIIVYFKLDFFKDLIAKYRGNQEQSQIEAGGNNVVNEKTEEAVEEVKQEEAKPLVIEEAYKGVVKIKTFVYGSYYDLEQYSSGSGIIINEKGLVLTNYHVVTSKDDYDKSEKDAGFLVCLSQEAKEEPDCAYSAKLIAKNEDLDVALLQIEPIFGMSEKTTFPFLKLSAEDKADINNEITVIGYPGIGEETVTVTKGIVSGKLNKYDMDWIKTDAIVSFGNSGGAGINKEGEVVGVATMSHMDINASLGYLINILSLNNFINDNKLKSAVSNELIDKVAVFAKKEKDSKNGDVFINAYPSFEITKPIGWDFEYLGENILQIINKKEESKSGSVNLISSKMPYLPNKEDIIPYLEKSFFETGVLQHVKIDEEKDVDIGGSEGKFITISSSGNRQSSYYFTANEYLFLISYNYGENEKDKDLVKGIINSIKIKPTPSNFVETFEYASEKPVLSLKTNSDWPILKSSEKSNPLIISYKKSKNLSGYISLEKIKDENRKLTSKDYLEKIIKEEINSFNQFAVFNNARVEITESNPNYKLNSSLSDVIRMKSEYVGMEKGKVLGRSLDYYINAGDEYINVGFNLVGDDLKIFNEAVLEFDKILNSLSVVKNENSILSDDSISSSTVEEEDEEELDMTADFDKDGLTDVEELIIGTDPNNFDTDGDGYGDGEELENGYNPLGAGKLE